MKGFNSTDERLQELLALPIEARLTAIARDVGRKVPRYGAIAAHKLAEALGVPQADRPGSDWSFTRYAEILTIEEYARLHPPASELIHLLTHSIEPTRLQCLLQLFRPLDDDDTSSFSFLQENERALLEREIAVRQLQLNEFNGLCCIARYTVTSPHCEHLTFEGDIEDDGSCINLRSPYDQHAGHFLNLGRCITHSW